MAQGKVQVVQGKKLPRALRLPLRLLGLLVIGYVLWSGAVYFMQDGLIFPRKYVTPVSPDRERPQRDETLIELTADDGVTVYGLLWLPTDVVLARTSGKKVDPVPLVVWLHGNAERIEQVRDSQHLDPYKNKRVAVLLPEYRGYGRMKGEPSQAAITNDIVKLIDQVLQDPRIDRSRVVYHGRSLGSGFACDVAKFRPPAALVLECPFMSLASMAKTMWVPSFLVKHPMRNDEFLPGFNGPVLVFAATNDEVIPVKHARELVKLAKQGTLVEQNATHLSFPKDWDEYERAIGEVLGKLGVAK